ncbi:apolipoprotein L2-like [Perognathus longimembris pacificus]|uniref:apolipoprotein L2-like n=1 Tax=Perognathus longimembris pacificus TaxID=214514 RepID=UPI0020192E44|nr:apolipoprotein L2-like [Perognathus longimembris pacificus]
MLRRTPGSATDQREPAIRHGPWASTAPTNPPLENCLDSERCGPQRTGNRMAAIFPMETFMVRELRLTRTWQSLPLPLWRPRGLGEEGQATPVQMRDITGQVCRIETQAQLLNAHSHEPPATSKPTRGRFCENQSFIDQVIEYLQDTVSREELRHVLKDDDAWEAAVAKAELSREEADELRGVLKMLTEDADDDDEDEDEKDLQDRKRFLEEFPRVRLELEERMRKLRDLADRVDKVHRDCTISHVVAGSTGVVSGVLTILGLALAPVTAGVSLALSATGMGLGTAADVASVATRVVDTSTKLSAKAEASSLLSTEVDKAKVVALTQNCFRDLPRLQRNIRAANLAKANPCLAASAKRLMTTGKISARSTEQVQKAFGGTALAMTKGARVMGAATAGDSLLMDVINLVKESTHLHQGAKTESAEELRRQALELERRLEELIRVQESLQSA